MSKDDGVDIALPEVGASDIFAEHAVAQTPIERSSFAATFPAMARFVSATVLWLWQNTRYAMLTVIILLVFVELGARALEPRFIGRIYDVSTTAGYPLDLNRDGYRGPLLEDRKASGVARIMTLGDSVSFGTGVPYDATWPFALERILDPSASGRAEALSLAAPASELRQIEAGFARYAESHDPDLAIILLTGNMISLEWANADAEPDAFPPAHRYQAVSPEVPAKNRLKNLSHAFAIPGVLTIGMEHLRFAAGLSNHLVNPEAPFGVLLAHGIRQGDLPPARAEEAWSRATERLRAIKDLATARGIPLIVSYAPARFMLSDALSDNLKSVPTERFTIDPIERAESICRDLGIPFVRVETALREAMSGDEPAFVLSDYTHFDRAGHHAVAQALASSPALTRALKTRTSSAAFDERFQTLQ